MEQEFEKLKKEGHNSVDNLIKWMKDSQLLDQAKAEEEARKLFADVKDTTDVELEKFKEVVAKLAADQKKTVEEFSKKLGEQGTKLLSAAIAGASAAATAGAMAFKEAMEKK